MISVGLITYHHVPNFGAFLQTWALVQTVRKLGCEVTVIDYRPPALARTFARKGWRAWVPSLGGWRAKRFMRHNLPLGEQTLRSREQVDRHVRETGYELLICGSDQIWLKDQRIPFDRTYLLDLGGEDGPRRISYAPSFGNMSSYGDESDEARRLISRLDAISVRDDNALRILHDLGIGRVACVVDPTLLADFDELITRPRRGNDFIAVVGKTNPAATALVRRLADLMSLPVVAVGTRCEAADVERRFVHAGEWAGYIAEARFVVTSLFHGALMAIRFRTPLLALDSAGRGFKLADVLGRFGLQDRFLSQSEEGTYRLPASGIDMDYSSAEARIQAAVQASMSFLRKALHG